MTKFHTPDWVKDAVFYQIIFPDRFAKSSRLQKPSNLETWDSRPTVRGFKGGDLLGVLEKLDYLQDLGINAVYLNPVFKSAANHRYHTYDYLSVDPLLGGNESLRALLDEAHGRGIRIILEGVFSHASRGFYKFHHILENGRHSPYIDWFIIKKFPVRAYDEGGEPNYAAWWGLHALPKLNIRNPTMRLRYIELRNIALAFKG
jgi:cyclomaltodextrinase / maltogenic alpha-amylase / neopullulanase